MPDADTAAPVDGRSPDTATGPGAPLDPSRSWSAGASRSGTAASSPSTRVDSTLRAGEILGLVGPNGAGKTTLVDLITGAQASDGGTLTLQGSRLSGSAAARLAPGLARTFQYPQLALDLTVRENLPLGRTARRMTTVRGMVASLVTGFWRVRDDETDAAVEAVAAEVRLDDIDRDVPATCRSANSGWSRWAGRCCRTRW